MKEQLLFILENSGGERLSGEDLAKRLGVSRQAIWKNVRCLQEEGYVISGTAGKGYTLSARGDHLSAEAVTRLLSDVRPQTQVRVYNKLDSTNNKAKLIAASGFDNDLLVIAKEQTAGRGRRGHSFFSPPSGLYMSLLFRPEQVSTDTALYTICAANSVADGIQLLCKEKPDIKWVNDVYVRGKKVCGILTEAVTDMETKETASVVIGIGVNLGSAEVPEELADKVGMLGSTVTRAEMAAEIVKRLYFWLGSSREDIVAAYRARSMVIGREVSFVRNGNALTGTAVDIGEWGELSVRLPDGSSLLLNSGEISVAL